MAHGHNTTLSRRAALASAAVASVAAAVPALALASADPDAELYRLIDTWRAAEAHYKAIDASSDDLSDGGPVDRAGIAACAALMAVIYCPANTPAGLVAKARVWREENNLDISNWDGTAETSDQLVLIAFMLDAERMAGRAQA